MGSSAPKNAVLTVSIFLTFFLSYLIIRNLSFLKETIDPEAYLIRIALGLTAFFLPILGGWISYGFAGGAIFSLFATIMVFFVMAISSSTAFAWSLLEYAGFSYLVFRILTRGENQIADISVDREKIQNEKNDLEVSHKAKGEGISILFEKYSTYYNLRKLAEDLASSLSVSQLAPIIVKRCYDFIGHGDVALIGLTDPQGLHLALAAYQSFSRTHPWEPSEYQGADLFDHWVIKNQRRLIITDAHQDFRFDVKEAARQQNLRSLIIAPILHERRVVGTLRVNSGQRETFSNDDLRLLDTISVLASSALSNAMLYEKTEDLAIRDSLTGLYVRRYFYDRLKNEHRRALIGQRPLSLFMCDLDHFKECNDRYGHGVGDLMLIEFAGILRRHLENAIISRYGGEEFAVLLPEISKESAATIAEKLRQTVEEYAFTIRRQRIAMTVSIGVSNLPVDSLDLEMLLQKADQALYQAKKTGRNRVCSSVP